MQITAQDIVKITSYFTIISHVKGRLRVRVNPKITQEASNITTKDIEDLSTKIDGIKKIKINKIVASITIEYDNNIFPKQIWDDLISGKNLDEAVAIITKLKKEIE
jgi:hypothetical protein